MSRLEKKIKNRYFLFIATIIVIIIAVLIFIKKNVNNQIHYAELINKSGKQRMLSQKITKTVFFLNTTLDETLKSNSIHSLKKATEEIENAHIYLYSINNDKDKNSTIDSLLKAAEPNLDKISTSSKNIINNTNSKSIKQNIEIIAEAEPSYLTTMDAVAYEYQKISELKLQKLLKTIYFLAIIAALILIGEFLFILVPALKQLFKKNKALEKANNDLAISENKIKENVLELTNLKTDLEIKDAYNKVFIEQAPTAIAMLDNNMRYIAASQRWISDYKMEGQDIIGRSHYDLFPEIGDDWKANHQKCLKGAIDVCDGAPFVRADGTTQWIYWDVRPWYISEGNIGGLIMHTGDITDQKEKEEERIKIEKILDKTNQVARIGGWELDLIRGKVYWSKVICEIHEVDEGYEPNLETAINFYKEGESRVAIEKAVKESMEHGTPFDLEVEIVTAKNNVVWVRAMGQAEFVDGKCKSIFGIFQDISSSKDEEEERIKIEKILDKTNEVARIGAWEINLVKDRIFWSKMVRDIHEVPEDYEPDLETAINFLKEGESRDTIRKVVQEAIEHGTPYDVEIELVTLNGNILWTRAIGQAEFVDGKCTRLFGVFQDINDKKLSQLALNKAHTELKSIFDSGSIAIVATEVDGIISQFNRGAEILTGYSASEMIGLHRPTAFHLREELDEFRIDMAKKYGKNPVGFSAQKEMSKHNDYDTREWHYLRKDGSTLPIQLTLTSMKDEKGELIGYLGIGVDISEKRMAQDELLRKNQLLNYAEEITLMGNWQWNTVADKVEWSNNLYNIFKLDKETENLNFDTYFNFVHPDDKEIVTEYFDRTVDEKRLDRFTHRIIAGDGTLKIVQLLGEVITNDKGEVIEMIGTCQDITASKIAEKELHDANLQLKAIFNSGPIAIVTTDLDGIINYFNYGAEILTGYSASEMIGLQTPFIYHTEEELEQFTIDIAKKYNKNPEGFHPQLELSQNNDYDTREWTYVRKDGSTLPIQLTLTGIKDEQGNDIGFLGVSTDVSERRKAQDELLRKNKLLNFAEEITMMGNWQIDMINNSEKWSRNLYHIFGLDEDTEITTDTFSTFIHPEDKKRVAKHIQKSIKDKNFTDLMFRIVLRDGTIKTVINLAEIITDDLGNVIEMIGTCQDITAIKAVEKELYDAHMQLKAIFNSGPVAIMSTDNTGIINHFNHGAELLLGYSASEVLGIKEPEIFHFEDELQNFKEDIAKKYNKNPEGFDPYLEIAKNNAFDTREWTFRKKDGSTFPVELTLTAIKNEQGKKIGFLGVSTDISERKKAKNELLRKNQLLGFAEEINLMGNWQSDLISNAVKFSDNLYNILGLEKNSEVNFNTYISFVHPEDQKKVAKHRQNTILNKKFDDLVHKIKLKDGTVKIVQLRAKVITDKSGNIIEVFGTCQDVTAQKMAENKFRGLLESAPDAIVIVDERGKIQLINKQAEKLFGYSVEELFEKPVEILIPSRFTGNHTTHRDGFFSKPKTRAMGVGKGKELFGMNKSGEEIPIQISLSPLQTEDGLLVSAAIRDITEQKLAENKIIRAKNDLERLAKKLTKQNNQLADFAHITSHNLRAPVSNLNSLLEFYNESETLEEKASLFKKFEKVIEHLTVTLNTLVETINMRNIDTHHSEDIFFDEIFNATKEILSGQIIMSGAIITSDFTKINKINYNKIYMESIFLNLISNAIKYKSEDRVPEIFIQSDIENGKIILKFKDNGLGIDLKRHGHKLFGLNKVFHRHPDAKGLGLFITKTQIEAMNGTITATSKVNEGSTFHINF